MTHAIPIYETSLIFLLALPFGQRGRRTLLALGMIAMHCAFSTVMNVGTVSTTCMSLWVAMLPATSEAEKVRFHTLNRATGNRVHFGANSFTL